MAICTAYALITSVELVFLVRGAVQLLLLMK